MQGDQGLMPDQGTMLQLKIVHATTEKEKKKMDDVQAGIKIARRNINNLRYADDTTLMAESKEELKSPLMKVKEESEKLA